MIWPSDGYWWARADEGEWFPISVEGDVMCFFGSNQPIIRGQRHGFEIGPRILHQDEDGRYRALQDSLGHTMDLLKENGLEIESLTQQIEDLKEHMHP